MRVKVEKLRNSNETSEKCVNKSKNEMRIRAMEERDLRVYGRYLRFACLQRSKVDFLHLFHLLQRQ